MEAKTKNILLAIAIAGILSFSSVFAITNSATLNTPATETITYGTGIAPAVTIVGPNSSYTVNLYDNGHLILTNTSIANNTQTTLISSLLLPGGSDSLIVGASATGTAQFNSSATAITVNKAVPVYSFPIASKYSTGTASILLTFTAPTSATVSAYSTSTGLGVSVSNNKIFLSAAVSGGYSFEIKYAGNENYSGFTKTYSTNFNFGGGNSGVSIPPVVTPPSVSVPVSTTGGFSLAPIASFFSAIGNGIHSLASAISSFFGGLHI
jgi:hypothetical protein